MIDFGLKPCPMCGGEATVEHLTQGPEQLRAVIKCSTCGLTLDWETEINVGVSRSGKRTPVKTGLDPIEAWNQRQGCETCDYKRHSDQVGALNNCNDCGNLAGCDYVPITGEYVRINCPLWRPMEGEV